MRAATPVRHTGQTRYMSTLLPERKWLQAKTIGTAIAIPTMDACVILCPSRSLVPKWVKSAKKPAAAPGSPNARMTKQRVHIRITGAAPRRRAARCDAYFLNSKTCRAPSHDLRFRILDSVDYTPSYSEVGPLKGLERPAFGALHKGPFMERWRPRAKAGQHHFRRRVRSERQCAASTAQAGCRNCETPL
jgi:hypothetical protein